MVPSKSVLSELAKRILIEHKAAEDAARSAVEHAHAAGKLLMEAKAAVGHGHFGEWLAENFARDGIKLSARTAQAYMRVATRWPELAAKAQSAAHLSLNEALQVLAAPKPQAAEQPAPEIRLPDLRPGFKFSVHGRCANGSTSHVEIVPSKDWPGYWYAAVYVDLESAATAVEFNGRAAKFTSPCVASLLENYRFTPNGEWQEEACAGEEPSYITAPGKPGRAIACHTGGND